jgi:hypothetical protein
MVCFLSPDSTITTLVLKPSGQRVQSKPAAAAGGENRDDA